MAANASDGPFPLLLVKKLGGLVSIVIGCMLTAIGVALGYTGTIVIGVLFLALGAVLLTLKIISRNQERPLG